ncbi:RNA polymerase factor sigma-54 [Dethiothermospora halolimnae]|uniref:RNA polymerase factor sigma-54 n=1 Tax=Dethiothermospora halolimnae TaxID=3114390 RepID=UPI003CCBFFE6
MKLGFDLNLQQVQKLVMTPELRQAIQMLQFNSQELKQCIELEMEKNPVLELENDIDNEDIEKAKEEEYDFELDDLLNRYDNTSYKNIQFEKKEHSNYEDYTSEEMSLKDYLLFQINLTFFNKEDKDISQFIIESIDNNGYLNASIDEIANEMNTEHKKVKNIVEIIQTFEPSGVGARDLKECLKIQLKRKKIDDPNVYKVVEEHLEYIGTNSITKLAKQLKISTKEVQNICDLIKTLEPKPGRGFSNEVEEIKFITPDIILHEVDDEYIIVLNDNAIPRLNISKYYNNLLKTTDEEKISEYLKNKLNSALWIIKSIEQRRMTIYNVTKSIIKFQYDFFKKGKRFLKPLTLKDIAEDIEVHESTVSRATTGKYIQTPRGIFELKFFFSSGISKSEGAIASTGIKTMIEELITTEDSKKPLSDQKIANILKEKNIQISRRTVAKYRDELNIPSSSKRRRF